MANVSVCATLVVLTCWLPKVRYDEVKLTIGTTPIPPSETCCVRASELSVKVSAPARWPVTLGVKVTSTVQSVPTTSAEPTGPSVVGLKSPLVAMLVSERGPLPALLNVAVWTELGEPTSCEPKFSAAGNTPTVGVLKNM